MVGGVEEQGFSIRVHLFDLADHHSHAVIFGEAVVMVVDEFPVKSIPGVAPVSARKIRHFEDVCASGNIWFRGEGAVVGELGHSVDVGGHYPVGGVDEVFHEPRVDFVGVDSGHEHGGAEHHEAFNVVTPAVAEDSFDGVVERRKTGRTVVPRGGHFSGGAERFELSLV